MAKRIERDTEPPWTRFRVAKYLQSMPLESRNWYQMSENLCGENLSGLDLSGLDFSYTSLRRTKFVGAKLGGAIFRDCQATYADFTGADLTGANFDSAGLDSVDFTGANLGGASFKEATIRDSKFAPAVYPDKLVVLPEGEFTGYKKVMRRDYGFAIVELRIPAHAKRVSPWTSCKCRASEARVVKATTVQGVDLGDGPFFSIFNRIFNYRVGQLVVPDDYDPDPTVVCSAGIHFFSDLGGAVAYCP